MPFAEPPLWVNNVPVDAAGLRRMFAMLLDYDPTSPRGALAGIRPGSASFTTTIQGGTTISVSVGNAAVQGAPNQGIYLVVSDTAWTTPLQAADATNPRVDLVYVRVWDNDVDGSGLTQADLVYLPGIAAASPVAPSIPAGQIALPIAQITVPKSGGGSPSVSQSVRPVTVGPGGILPSATAPASPYVGKFWDDGTNLRRWNGSTWETYGPVPAQPAAVTYKPTWTGLSALGNSVSSGRYIQSGKLVTMTANLDWGSGSSLGTGFVYCSLPVPAAAPGGNQGWIGGGRYVDGQGSSWKGLTCWVPSGESKATVYGIRPSDAGWFNMGNLGYTWASGAHMQIELTYEAA